MEKMSQNKTGHQEERKKTERKAKVSHTEEEMTLHNFTQTASFLVTGSDAPQGMRPELG